MPALSIRIATIEDIPSIQKIAFSTWPVAYSAIISQEQLDYMLNMFYSEESLNDQLKSGHTFFIAIQHQNCIGFASFSLQKKEVYKLQKLYVNPAIQKTGAGKLLLQEVINSCTIAGGKKLQLNVNRHNKAVGFYQKMGFEIIKEDDINIGHDYFMNDYVMERKL